MRIAYISLHWPRTDESGVGKKIIQQMKEWRQAGHEVRFFMHFQKSVENGALIEGDFREFKAYPGLLGRLQTEVNRIMAMRSLLKDVQHYQPDLIYLRWGMFVLSAQKMFEIAPVVMEINTNDVFQHWLLGGIYGIYNRLTRWIFLSRVSGFAFTSLELMTAREFVRYSKPGVVIANGCDLDEIKPIPAPNNDTPRLIFIGTPGFPWHGVDKLVPFAQKFPDLRIDVIGYNHAEVQGLIPENLMLHGYLKSGNYFQILSRVDVGLGTLALHRKGMEEASPLKTREYLAHGIPLVLSYRDTDLDDLDCGFLLHIPNREDNLETHGQAVHDFATRMRGVRVDRELIGARIDAHIKEMSRLAFFQEILTLTPDREMARS